MRYLPLALLFAVAPVAAQMTTLDVRAGAASSQPVPVGEAGGRLVFTADDGAGPGLFAADGADVTRLADGRARYQGARLDGALYLFLCDEGRRCALVRTDGTVPGTARIAALPDVERLGYPASTAERLFFLLRPAGADATQLWTSDGTAAGTRPVEGARPVVNDGLRYVVTAAEDRVFFSAGDGGTELWVSDGEGAGRAVTFDAPRWKGGFFYGTALGQGERAFALVSEAEPQGLYAVDEDGGRLVAPLRVGTSNETLVPFGDGVLFGAYAGEGGDAQPPRPVTFYAADADGVTRVSPDLPASGLRNHTVVSPLGDGSVALAVGRGGGAEVWRVAPGGAAQFAFRLADGEGLFSDPGLFDAAREARPAPAVALAGGALHALTSRADPDDYARVAYSLWRDAGDGTAHLVAEYAPDDPNDAPRFAEAGGAVYVAFATPEAGFELFALGRAATSEEPPATADRLAIAVEGAHPARDRVRLRVTAPPGERVRVEAFDVVGRRVAVLLDGPAPAAPLGFDVSGLAPGVYVVRVAAGAGRASVRVVVAR